MKEKFIALFMAGILALSCGGCMENGGEKNNVKTFNEKRALFPVSETISENIFTMSMSRLAGQGERLAAISLQGIVNRNTPEFYLLDDNSKWSLDYYKEKGYVKSSENIASLEKLIEKYADRVKGAVIYDPEKEFTVNTATNVAGSESRIIIPPKLEETVRKYGITDIKDLRDLDFTDAAEAYEWERDNYLDGQNKDVLACMYYSQQNDYSRDYVIQFNIHVFWLPGENDPEYSEKQTELVKKTLEETKVNIPVLGFWYSTDGKGNERGISEYGGVKLGGYYGKFTVVNDWVGNYSFHSGVPVDPQVFTQKKVRNKESNITYDPEKKYVAFVMIDSGDAPCYFQYAVNQYQWNDSYRGTVSMNMSITPALKYLAPGILEYLYETATEEDYFFCSISGIGYCYPLEGYGSLCSDPEEVLEEYFAMTAYQMETLDMDMLGLYSHPFSMWQIPDDDDFVEKYITKHPQIRSVIADMGRNDNMQTPNAMLSNDVTIHHTLTRWSSEDMGTPSSRDKDEAAVEYMVTEIVRNGRDTQFIQAMFYSWHYGPRRLKMVKDRLEAEGYVFLTLPEFDALYREQLS